MTEMDPNIARNWTSERLRKYMASYPSRDSFHSDQLAENDALNRRRGGEARISAAAAQGHGLDGVAVFVEGFSVALAGVVVEIELESGAGFGVAQLKLASPRRRAVFLGPDLNQQQLVAEISQVLQSALAAVVVQKIGNHDHQAALPVAADEFAHGGDVIGLAARLDGGEAIGNGRIAMAAAGCHDALREAL